MSERSAREIGTLIVDTQLASGRRIRIGAISPGDGAKMREGIANMSQQSRYMRFFSGAEELPDVVIERLLDVDGTTHLAWGALDCDQPGAPAIAAVHAIRSAPEEPMEFSAVVLDDYQGEGISKLLSAVLFAQCIERGERELVAHVLEENVRSKTYVANLGGERFGAVESVAHYRIDIARALDRLRTQEVMGAEAVHAALAPYLSGGNALL